MSNLILPDHIVAAQRTQQTKAALERIKEEAKVPDAPEHDAIDINHALVKEEDRVIDPSLLSASALQRMPQPTGWRILILPYKGSGKTKGGILMADETIERNTLATVVGYVLAVGPLAYEDKEKFPSGPWCKKGDWVMIGRYAGTRFRIEGGEVRIINDDEVIATIMDPADVLNV